ncbi:MAG: hypothetical protein HQM11_19940 [SAR324 cluster bacterium]|nr:hypothetical protein [SAR324 cluster bacterium]
MSSYENIVKRTWSDSEFKSLMLSNPKSALSQMGLSFGDDVEVKVYDDSGDTQHYVLLHESQTQGMDLDSDPIIGKITKKAQQDSSYRKRLLSDSKSAIREVLGTEPAGKIAIHENTASLLNIVLPSNPGSSGELSDSDLASVAGGKGLTINCDTVGGLMSSAGNLTSKVGSYLPGNFGGLFSSLGPIMTGGGSAIGKASGFLGFMGS